MYFRWGGAVSGEGESICLANNGVAVGDTWGLGRKCSASAEIQSEGGGQEPLRESGVDYDLHCAAIFHDCETMALVERRVFALLGHHLEEHIAGIALLDTFDEATANMHALIFRIHQHPMHIGEHFTVIDDACQARELIAIPCADDGAAANQGTVDAVRVLRRFPADQGEQFVDLVLREALLIRVFDCPICRLYPGVYIRGVQGWRSSVRRAVSQCAASHDGTKGISVARWCEVRYRTTEWAALAFRDVAICALARRPQYRSRW